VCPLSAEQPALLRAVLTSERLAAGFAPRGAARGRARLPLPGSAGGCGPPLRPPLRSAPGVTPAAGSPSHRPSAVPELSRVFPVAQSKICGCVVSPSPASSRLVPPGVRPEKAHGRPQSPGTVPAFCVSRGRQPRGDRVLLALRPKTGGCPPARPPPRTPVEARCPRARRHSRNLCIRWTVPLTFTRPSLPPGPLIASPSRRQTGGRGMCPRSVAPNHYPSAEAYAGGEGGQGRLNFANVFFYK